MGNLAGNHARAVVYSSLGAAPDRWQEGGRDTLS